MISFGEDFIIIFLFIKISFSEIITCEKEINIITILIFSCYGFYEDFIIIYLFIYKNQF
jgi:hypothetical protein